MTEVRSARPVGSAALDVEALHDLLASSFEVSVGKPVMVWRTSLDTFGRRLERAGQRLQLVAEAGKARELLAGEKPHYFLTRQVKRDQRTPVRKVDCGTA